METTTDRKNYSISEDNYYDEEKNSDSWEILSDSDSGKDVSVGKQVSLEIDALHRCASTPNFSLRTSLYSADEFSDIDSSFDVQSFNTEGVQSTQKVPNGPVDDWSTTANIKKIPSFKDMLLMNADNKQDQARKDLQHKLQRNVEEKKQITRTYVVSQVTSLKRCGFSTGDLQNAHMTNKSEFSHQSNTIPEDEVLGDSDAMEFYHQKALGSSSRVKGLKLRPDEAKRKEYSIYKRESNRNS